MVQDINPWSRNASSGIARRLLVRLSVPLAIAGALSCSTEPGPGGGSGGHPDVNTGGDAIPNGGTPGSGGLLTGGNVNTGGFSSSGGMRTGGLSSTGGNISTGGISNPNPGGVSASGGVRTGGTTSTGGTSNTGGTPNTGGLSTSGGVRTGGTTSTGGITSTGGSNTITGGVTTTGTVDATAMAKAMGFGTNIGNTLENTAGWETGWGQPLITQTYIKGMASRGIKTVRVPVAWDTYANNGVIDATKMNRVKEVVGWIEAAGMYSIVNIHWDGGWIFNENKANAYKLTDDVKTKFANYWKQIGTAFSSVGHRLIFEGLNEEARYYINGDSNGTPDIAALNTINQLFVTTIRAQGGYNATRALLIAGFQTDITKTCVNSFTVPTDPAGTGKLFLSLHYYDPYPFTLMEDPASWGSPTGTWGTAAEKKAVEDMFTKLGNFSTSKKIPIILGEFAVTLGTKVVRQSSARIAWMQAVAQACFSRGMVPVLWDTGSEIKRTDGSFSTEFQTVMNNVK